MRLIDQLQAILATQEHNPPDWPVITSFIDRKIYPNDPKLSNMLNLTCPRQQVAFVFDITG